jgi:Bacteriophage lambda head decoration protein D
LSLISISFLYLGAFFMSQVIPGQFPGIQPKQESEEKQLTWAARQGLDYSVSRQVVIDAATVDATNSPTTQLRAGLVMARRDSDGKYVQYDPAGTNGSQIAVGVLEESLNMLDASGNTTERFAQVLFQGLLRKNQLIGLDTRAELQLAESFLFDQPTACSSGVMLQPRGVYRKSSDYTVLHSEQGALFVATAAVTFTLPEKRNGLTFRFLQSADALLRITGAADIVYKSSAASTNLLCNTSNEKIGSHLLLECVFVSSSQLKWVATNLGGTTVALS